MNTIESHDDDSHQHIDETGGSIVEFQEPAQRRHNAVQLPDPKISVFPENFCKKLHQSQDKTHLVTLSGDLGELENDGLSGELLVNSAEGVDLVVNTSTLLGVEEDLDDLVAVLLGADALANDQGGEDKVLQDGIVDSGQSARTGALLLDTGTTTWRRKNAALRDEHNVTVGELLLELTSEAEETISIMIWWGKRRVITAAGPCGNPAEEGPARR
jgi:hypothetical protein